jgi:hypothetical protein
MSKGSKETRKPKAVKPKVIAAAAPTLAAAFPRKK